MDYLVWVIIALLAYSLVAPLASVITSEVPAVPALFISTLVFLLIIGSVMLVTGVGLRPYLFTRGSMYLYVAGLFITIGILAYVLALDAGPISTVVPIFGMFIVGSSVIGFILLDEQATLQRAVGIICAILAIYLAAGGRS